MRVSSVAILVEHAERQTNLELRVADWQSVTCPKEFMLVIEGLPDLKFVQLHLKPRDDATCCLPMLNVPPSVACTVTRAFSASRHITRQVVFGWA